jgi:Zn-dependent M28 family amino/carboxypeptidase
MRRTAFPWRAASAVAVVAAATALGSAANTPVDDEQKRWWGHLQVLAADELEGRRTGTTGFRTAAEYVATQFAGAGLEPAGTAGFAQPVRFRQRRILEEKSSLALVRDGRDEPLRLGPDATFNVRVDLASSVDAPLVFVGYGLSAPDVGHDDLAGLDLRGKVAVFLTGSPAAFPGALAAHYQNAGVRWAGLRAAGAIGTVSLSRTSDLPWERSSANRLNPALSLADPRFDELAGQQLGVTFNPASAERLFAGSGHTFADLLALAGERQPLPRFALPAAIRARVALEVADVECRNVVARLPGSDQALAAEHVVLSAHLDHLGIGAEVAGDRIYNGAMDNASGVATLIETARALGAATPRPKRSVLFVALTAEENGLLGSRYFAGNPSIARGAIVANINLDMFLPLYPMTMVTVLGLEESTLGDTAREVAGRASLAAHADPQPQRNRFTRSDQYSFIKRGVPALALKVGFKPGSPEAEIDARWTKERYHAPSDDLRQPLDLAAAVTFTRYVGALAAETANRPERPRWKSDSFFRRFATND